MCSQDAGELNPEALQGSGGHRSKGLEEEESVSRLGFEAREVGRSGFEGVRFQDRLDHEKPRSRLHALFGERAQGH